MTTAKQLILTAFTILCVVAARHFLVNRHTPLPPIPPERLLGIIPHWRELSSEGHWIGSPVAPITLVVFSDYRCPACRSAHEAFGRLREEYSATVAVVYRHFPVRGPLSRAAAAASACAGQSGHFEMMHESLFAQVDSFGFKPWHDIALQAGVQDTIRFNRCLADGATDAMVSRDVEIGRGLGVRGTPAVLLDSILFIGRPSMSYLRAYVEGHTAAR